MGSALRSGCFAQIEIKQNGPEKSSESGIIVAMQLLDLIDRTPVPIPWAEGDNIPWHDPEFSVRMLREHLSQSHDAASRRLDKIDRQVAWIHTLPLHEQPTHVLDLGCGPGLYSERLARLGHSCVGIDYSPASIAYAQDTAKHANLPCMYVCQDIRRADYGTGFGLVMLLYGEFNVFRLADAQLILGKARQALEAGGRLLLEPHTFSTIQKIGQQSPTWYTSRGGLFSSQPHLVLQENHWHTQHNVATIRYFIVDAATGQVTRHAQSFQAYTDEEYRSLLESCGFTAVEFFPSLGEVHTDSPSELIAITANAGSL
jgi:SAM-dependent methyltransferase